MDEFVESLSRAHFFGFFICIMNDDNNNNNNLSEDSDSGLGTPLGGGGGAPSPPSVVRRCQSPRLLANRLRLAQQGSSPDDVRIHRGGDKRQ
jgi:hypothetical protein